MFINNLSDKYVVIKSEDFADALLKLNDTGHHAASVALQQSVIPGDYFVIREHDVFGPAGLHAYAANIRTTLEVMEVTGLGMLDSETVHNLETLADALTETACSWQVRHGEVMKRIPG